MILLFDLLTLRVPHSLMIDPTSKEILSHFHVLFNNATNLKAFKFETSGYVHMIFSCLQHFLPCVDFETDFWLYFHNFWTEPTLEWHSVPRTFFSSNYQKKVNFVETEGNFRPSLGSIGLNFARIPEEWVQNKDCQQNFQLKLSIL